MARKGDDGQETLRGRRTVGSIPAGPAFALG